MAPSTHKVKVYLEVGRKRVFAGALDWPGWSRSGPDEDSALQALFEYGARYARLLRVSRLGFKAPTKRSEFAVVERLQGNATTDFGAPGIAPAADADSVDDGELKRFQKVLKACWRAFDQAVEAAGDKALRTGPRGGGRQLEGIFHHLVDSDTGYVNQVGWKFRRDTTDDLTHQLELTRQAVLQALSASARGEIPARGPRGGLRWSARYFVRRLAWHVVDHTWEIEERMISS